MSRGIAIIDQFNLILKELDDKPELISSISSCIKSDDVTKVMSASEEFWLSPNSNHVTDSNIKKIISEIIECLKGNRLKEFVGKEGADVSIELSFYDAFNEKIKELFVGDDFEGIVIKILEKVGEVKNIVNDLNALYVQSENLTQNTAKIKEEYKSYFENFNVNTYVIKVYDEDSYKFLTISLPEHHELNLENLKVQPFIGSDGNLKKVNIVLENTQKFSKDYYDKYINGCEKRTLSVEKYSYDDGSIVLHGNENDKAINSKIQDYFPIIESQNVEVIDYHCLA